MWLLDTHTYKLHFFSNDDIPRGGYAILSHRWDDSDNDCQFDTLRITQDTQGAGTGDVRDHRVSETSRISDKVCKFCTFAKKRGFQWVWIDSCCINKRDNVELSEAINSMFRWYARAEVCFAYLADVPEGSDLRSPGSAFRRSEWHTRGWTLQELVAPHTVIFLSKEWSVLNTKHALSDLLEEVTGIHRAALSKTLHYTSFSVAERMSWASRRKTTRIEDQAYCLMGLFDVNLPTIYGEGHHAFKRLQEEIMRRSLDPSLFVWGDRINCRDSGFKPFTLKDKKDDEHKTFTNWTRRPVYLLANSPSDFEVSQDKREVIWAPNSTNPVEPILQWQEDRSFVSTIAPI